jgi:hypothetical protein
MISGMMYLLYLFLGRSGRTFYIIALMMGSEMVPEASVILQTETAIGGKYFTDI